MHLKHNQPLTNFHCGADGSRTLFSKHTAFISLNATNTPFYKVFIYMHNSYR